MLAKVTLTYVHGGFLLKHARLNPHVVLRYDRKAKVLVLTCHLQCCETQQAHRQMKGGEHHYR